MKSITRAVCLPVLLLFTSCLVLGACSQGGKGGKSQSQLQPPAAQPPADTGPFAGKTMVMKMEAYTFNISLEEVLENANPDYALTNINLYKYDDLGRFLREAIVTLPQSPTSNIPPTGAIAYSIEFTYSDSDPAQEEFAIQDTWDAWSDQSSGAHTQTIVWQDDIEEHIYYNDGQMTSIFFAISKEFNAQGYLTRSTSKRMDIEEESTWSETFYRAPDGKRLESIVNTNETIEFQYDLNGVLQAMRAVKPNSLDVTTYTYWTQADRYLIGAQTRSFDHDGIETGIRTAVEIFKSGFCHEATRRRDIFQRPNWAPCREFSDWK